MLFSVKQAFVGGGRGQNTSTRKNARIGGYLHKGQVNSMCLPIFRGKRSILLLNPVLIFIEFHPTERAWKGKVLFGTGKYSQLLITQTF